jgi:hypothetical protein
MNTQIIRFKLAPSLTQEEEKVVLATKEKKVYEAGRKAVEALVSSIVTSSMIVLGNSKKFDDRDRFLIEKEIVNDIFSNFKGLTLDEIRLACSRGCRGEYKAKPDEVVYFSVKSVYEWIKAYIVKTKREAMQKQARFEQDRFTKAPLTDEEKKKLESDFIKDCIIAPYNHFVKTGEFTFDLRGNIVYETLDKLNAIPFTVKRKKEIFERAKHLTIVQLEQYPSFESRNRMNDINEGEGEGHRMVKSKAKELALMDFLREMKEQDMDLEEWIEMRRV